jgi:vesicle coat complex subunit
MPSKGRFGFGWGGGSSAPTYTPAERKGEINELKTLLRDPAVAKDQPRQRDVLKKVLGFMTLGVDTSALFTEMILACVTKDIVQKKMVYFYLCANSEGNSELAILAINTLQKDCRDESPLVRGLALRSLASFRLPQIAEYLVPTLKECLTDRAPYVRKTAILSTLRLYRAAPEAFRQMGLIDKMHGMLRDNDGVVLTNALAVLSEVLEPEGGVQVNKGMLYFLLNKLRDLTEWQQVQVLQLVLKYTPANEDETFDIMNLLEERLRGSNSAVIVACSNVFLHLTQNLPTVHEQVFDRLREPLVTLFTTAHNYEIMYAVLCHVKLLAERQPKAFQASHKDFFCRLSDPSYIKSIKIDVLGTVACDKNADAIVGELIEYVADSNMRVSRMAIAALAKIALRVESCAKRVLDAFLELLTMDVEHIRGQTLVAMKDFLRKHTSIDIVRPFLDQLITTYKDMAFTDDESRIALVWVLGEFGEHIQDAPYLIEDMLPNFPNEVAAMRIELLTSLMKLFFKRPPEVQPVLGKAFSVAINDFSHADVHDRALLYYRLLRTNPQAAAQVVCASKQSVQTFVEDDTADTRDRLFEEFGTMSVIYGQPSAHYLKTVGAELDSDDEDEESEADDEADEDEEAALIAAGGGGVGNGSIAGSSTSGAPAAAAPSLQLDADVEIESPDFQGKWGKYGTIGNAQLRMKKAPDAGELEDELNEHEVFTMAAGQQGTTLKVYLYSKVQDQDQWFLAELVISATLSAQLTVKSNAPQLAAAYQMHFTNALKPFLA